MKMKFLLIALLTTPFLMGQEDGQDDLKHWWHKDLEKDSIPGIGLERAYDELIPGKEWHTVIVAVLDTKMDIEHEELKDQIWVNEDEIPDNNIDDDQNGFIDDIHGWNFLGNAEGGEVPYQSTEEVRIIQGYEKQASASDANAVDDKAYQLYIKAKESLEKSRERSLRGVSRLDSLMKLTQRVKDTLNILLPGTDYTISQLDSLGTTYPELAESLQWMSRMKAGGFTEADLVEIREYHQNSLDLVYNPDMDDRENVDGGNPKVKDNSMPFQHATPITSLIVANRNNNVGLMGVSDKIVIMPVVMVSTGDEHDEDVAKAIRYAVDNGAHIINMSWGKYYSSQTQLVREAIIYAAEHDVLLVTASGNEGKDIDQELFYPIDFYDGKEVVSNFMVAGGLTHKVDSTLVASYSNYGKEQVDIFVPAARIYSANPDNQYDYGQGTSNASPILAGVAALLKGYYPDLSASEIKEILLASGDSIDLKVVKPGAEGEAPLVPFSSLSKTGKILNAYRALLLAEERSD